MKTVMMLAFVLLLPALSMAQLRSESEVDVKSALTQPAGTILFGWLDTSKLDIHHSFASTFSNFSGGSFLTNSYLGTLDYRFADPLALRLKLGVMNTPYSSFSNNPVLNSLNEPRFFGGAELQYTPTPNMSLTVGVESNPYAPLYYSPHQRYRGW